MKRQALNSYHSVINKALQHACFLYMRGERNFSPPTNSLYSYSNLLKYSVQPHLNNIKPQTSPFYRFIFGHCTGHTRHHIEITYRRVILFFGSLDAGKTE